MKLTDIFKFKLFERTDPVDMETVNKNFESVEKIFDGLTAEDVGALPTGGGSLTGEVTFEDALCSEKIEGTGISKIIILPRVPYGLVDSTHTTNVYFKELLKWICKNYPGKAGYTFFGDVNPSSTTFAQIRIYNTSEVDENGYPNYATGICPMLQGAVHSFGFNNYTFYFRTLLTNNDVVNNNTTTAAGYALDARQANPNVEGSLAKQISTLNSGLINHINNVMQAQTSSIYGTQVSIPNNTQTLVNQLEVKDDGLYLIRSQCTFVAASVGYRDVSIKVTDKKTNMLATRGNANTIALPSPVQTCLQCQTINALSLHSGDKIGLYANQNSGATLNVSESYISITRLK